MSSKAAQSATGVLMLGELTQPLWIQKEAITGSSITFEKINK